MSNDVVDQIRQLAAAFDELVDDISVDEVVGRTVEPADLDEGRWTEAMVQYPTSRRRHRLAFAAAAVLLIVGVAGAVMLTVRDGYGRNGPAAVLGESTSAEANTPDLLRVPNLVPATSPLYLLPPEGTDLSAGVDYWDRPAGDGSGLVVGRMTDTGFDDVVLIGRLTSGPTFGDSEGSVIEIAGRELRQPDHSGEDGTWTAAEELADGTWIQYTTLAGEDMLAEAVASTTVVDGQITWASTPGDLEELGRMADLQGSQQTWLSAHSGDDSVPSGFVIQTSIYDPKLGLALAGIYGPAERTTVDGRPAFLARPRSDLGRPNLALTWATSSGHVVLVIAPMTENDLRAFAAELQSVDRQTWEAALLPFTQMPGG